MNIYQKRGIWYAPKWRNPATGVTHPAHSLLTADRGAAESSWTLERAGKLGAVVALQPPPALVRTEALSDAIGVYLAHKAGGIEEETLEAYEGHKRRVLASLGNPDVGVLCSPVGDAMLKEWADAETKRLGRTHTVVKRMESIIKPALRHAQARGVVTRLPVWPELRSDYRSEGARKIHLTREHYARLVAELPERDRIDRKGGRAILVWPRLWADVIVSTGMHDGDVSRFARKDWDRGRRLWWRRNTKGDAHYPSEWFPVDAYLQAALERADDTRRLAPGDLWIASSEPPAQWMRRRLLWAAVRAGLTCKGCAGVAEGAGCARAGGPEAGSCVVPQPIDFRRTCATWLRDAGWEFDEVAKWLGNSTGMVREVYAQVPRARFVAAVAKAAPQTAALQELVAELFDMRKGPRGRRAAMIVSESGNAVASAVVNQQTRRG